MKHKKTRLIALILPIILILGTKFSNFTVKAKTDPEQVVKTYTGFVNGIERNLIITKSDLNTLWVYFQIGEEEPELVSMDVLDSGVDKYGSVWILDSFDRSISGWNYDLCPDDDIRWFETIPNRNDPMGYVHDVDSFIYEGTGSQAIIVGYKTVSGEINSLLTFEEMKAIVSPDSSVSEPSYVPKEDTPTEKPTVSEIPTLAPSTQMPMVSETPTLVPSTQEPVASEIPTLTPSTQMPMVSETPTLTPPTQEPETSEIPTLTPSTQEPAASETPTPSQPTQIPLTLSPNLPSVTVQPTVKKKVFIKKSKKKGKTTYFLCEGNKVVIQYTTKKSTLTWKTEKKKGKAKGIKCAGFIKKKRTLIFMDKKGRVYTVSKSGKKKRLLGLKKPKRFIRSGRFVSKVKTADGNINVRNK